MALKDVVKKAGEKLEEEEDEDNRKKKREDFIKKIRERTRGKQKETKEKQETTTEKSKEKTKPHPKLKKEKTEEKKPPETEETKGKTAQQLYKEMGEEKETKEEGGFHKPEGKPKKEEKPEMWEWPEVARKIKEKKTVKATTSVEEVQGAPEKLYTIPGEAQRRISSKWEPPDMKEMEKKYALVDPWSYARIKWDEDEERLLYHVLEPPLTPEEEEKLERINELLSDVLDVNLMKVTERGNVKDYLDDKLEQIIRDYGIGLTKSQYDKLLYYIYRNFLGLEKIEPLMHDPDLEDISCDGVGIPIYVYHRRLGSLKTNITYDDSDELDRFVTKLAQRTGKHISVAEPLLQGALPDGSRVQATYAAGKEIAMKGSDFTIRKFMEEPLTIIDQMNFGTIPALMGAFFWLSMEYRNSMLVSGGTATGKTGALNSLSMFLPRDRKILSVEDSVGGETSFMYENDGEMHFGEIGEYIDSEIEKKGYEVPSGHEVAEPKPDLKVPTVNENGKVEMAKPTALIRHKVKKPMYRIETDTGKEIETTGDHSLYILGPDPGKMDAEKYIETLLRDEGTVPKPFDTDLEIDLGQYKEKLEKKGYREITEKKLKSRKASINRKIKVTKDFLKLLGYITARGTPQTEKKSISIPSSDPEMNRTIKKQSREIGYKLHEETERNHKITSSPFYHALKALDLDIESHKIERRAPRWIEKLEREQKQAFINGLEKGNERPVYSLDPKICKAKVSELEPGDSIITPSRLPSGEGLHSIDLEKELDLEEERYSETEKEIKIGENTLPKKVEIDEELLELLGLWIADGCYDHSGNYVIVSAPAQETREVVERIGERFNLTVKDHTDGFSQNIYGKIFYKFMREVLSLEHGSKKKKFPSWVYKLDKQQTAALLRGYFAGDNDDGSHELGAASVSKELLQQLQTLLLRFGVRSNLIEKQDHHSLRISGKNNVKKMKEVGFIRRDRERTYEEIMNREPSHDKQDTINLPKPFLWKLLNESKNMVGDEWTYKTWKSMKTRYQKSKTGRMFLEKLLEKADLQKETKEELEKILDGDYRLETVKNIENKGKEEKKVYDFSVPPAERFVAGNILCSNTPEIRLPHEHWISKIATVTGTQEGSDRGEVSMFDLIKAGLRERPDEIIVGEVRGEEAYNLFQGMASLRGNQKVTVINPEGNTEHVPIKDLMNQSLEGYKTLAIDPETNQVQMKSVEACVEHEPREKLYKITTATGREVTVTGDHSIFVKKNSEVKEKRTDELEEGEALAVPAKAPSGYADKDYINLAKELEDIRVKAPEYVKKASKKIGWREAGDAAGVATISDYYGENTVSSLKAPQYYELLEEAEVTNSPDDIEVKFERRSETHPAKLEITPELLRLIGYYVSEGSLNTAYKNNVIQLYNSDEDVLKDMEKCIKEVTGKEPARRKVGGYGDSTELAFSHKVIYESLKQKCGHGSKEKEIPPFIFGLSKEKISEFLSALWTGDGSCTRKNFQYTTTSEKLADQVMHMLLQYGVVAHKYYREKKEIYQVEFYSREDQEKSQEHVKPINKKINLTREKKSSGRIDGEVYGDPVKEIEEIYLEEPEPVYDLNVPGPQNFIGGSGGIMLHNTGHPGLSTMHAESVDAVINRLKTPPINLSPGLLQHLDLIVIMGFAKVENMDVRRVQKVVEVVDVNLDTGRPITNELFTYIPSDDHFEFSSEESYILKEIKEQKGVSKESVWEELKRRASLLKWMQEKDITGFEQVGEIIARYYSDPDGMMKEVRKEKKEEN